MSKLSGTSFPIFDSEEICNLPARELVIGSDEIAQSTSTQTHTDHKEVLVRQASSAASRGDSQPDQSSLIREFLREELRRGLGCCGCRSEREGSSSSPSLPEGSRLLCSRSVRDRSRAPSCSRHSRSLSRHGYRSRVSSRSSHVTGGSSRSPLVLTCQSPVVPPVHVSRRTTPSCTVSQVPPSLLPLFVTPVAPLYSSVCHSLHSCFAGSSRPLLPLFPLMMPPPRYEPLTR